MTGHARFAKKKQQHKFEIGWPKRSPYFVRSWIKRAIFSQLLNVVFTKLLLLLINVKKAIDAFIKDGKVTYGWLGVSMYEISDAMKEQEEASKQVLVALKEMNESSSTVSATSKDMSDHGLVLRHETDKLETIANTVQGSME